MALLKAFMAGVKLPDRLPMGRTTNVPSGFALGGVGGGAVASMRMYGRSGVTYAIVSRISETIALVKWNLMEETKTGDAKLIDSAKAPAHTPSTALWTKPNPWMTRQEFLERSQQHIELAGRSWWVMSQGRDGPMTPSRTNVAKAGLEMWPIRPDRIWPVTDPDEYIIGYMYRAADGSEPVPLPKESVVQIVRPDPMDPHGAVGPVQAIMVDLESDYNAALHNLNFFRTGAPPGGVIQMTQPLSDTEFEKMTTRWREQHQGVANAHRVAVLDRGMQWVDAKITQRDMQWEQARHVNRDQALLGFGMFGSIMGISENVNRANAEAATVDFARWMLVPRLERIQHAYNEKVQPLFDPDQMMEYEDPTPSDQQQAFKEALDIWIARGCSLDEFRAAAGLPEIGGTEGSAYLPMPSAPALPSTPPALPADAIGGKTVKSWPASMQVHEQGIEKVAGHMLADVRRQAIDYANRR